ncbi:MAG: hypothetical protein MJ230_00725 [bacterium]|nr:hypothetical protein [bacterium]
MNNVKTVKIVKRNANGKKKTIRRKEYDYFSVDKFTYDTMQEKALQEQSRVKNIKNDTQRTLVQVELPSCYFKKLKTCGFEVQDIEWHNRDKRYKDIILDSYDFIVSSPISAGLDDCCENVVINQQFEEMISNYIENSPKSKIRCEVPPSSGSKCIYLSLPTLLAYKLKFSSMMSGVYMSDIITHLFGYFVPKMIVKKYGKYIKNKRYLEMENDAPWGTNYRVINRMWIEIFLYANDKVKTLLDLSSFNITSEDTDFGEEFDFFIDDLVTVESQIYQYEFH